jgi:hypothetical protein
MRNFEWVIPVIVFSVFVVGNILRILNWKNEQEKKAAARRPRVFQVPPPSGQPGSEEPMRVVALDVLPANSTRPIDLPPRPLRQIDMPRPMARERPQAPVSAEDLQRALRRNRAKVQRRATSSRVEPELPVVVPIVESVSTRMLRNEPPAQPSGPPAGVPNLPAGQGMAPLLGDLFNSPETLTKAMVLQMIFSPPLSKQKR